MMRPSESLQSLSVIKILGDRIRLEILQILMRRAATLSQLGREMDMHPAKIRHHLKKLEEAGLVEYISSREVRGFVEKYYQATAQSYFINYAVLPYTSKERTIFTIGSHDLALEILADQLQQKASAPNLVVIPVGSLDGLIALRLGFCQITGCHLLDPFGEEYNISYVRHLFPDRRMHAVTLINRVQGLIIAPENPRQIKGLEDLARDDLTFINRKRGSGTRMWLDRCLQQIGLDPPDIQGFDIEVNTHSQVAEAVIQNKADLGLGILAAARQYNLNFIPLFDERFDLVFSDELYQDPIFEPILNTIQDLNFRQVVSRMGGYDSTHTGEDISIY